MKLSIDPFTAAAATLATSLFTSLCLAIVIMLALPACSQNELTPRTQAASITAKQVIDGDSFWLHSQATAKKQKLQLAYIDAPEREQPFGREAKAFLQTKLAAGQIELIYLAADQVEVLINHQSLNQMMVAQGYAWAKPQIAATAKARLYHQAQQQARDQLHGLWRLGHGLMVAPWQWRNQAIEPLAGSVGKAPSAGKTLLARKTPSANRLMQFKQQAMLENSKRQRRRELAQQHHEQKREQQYQTQPQRLNQSTAASRNHKQQQNTGNP